MNMCTNNVYNNNAAFNNGDDKHNVSSTVHNQHMLIFQQKRLAIVNTDWYFDMLGGFLWPNGMDRVTYAYWYHLNIYRNYLNKRLGCQ